MELFKKMPFSFEGEDYEIRAHYRDRLITVAAFRNNYPANGFRHEIRFSNELASPDFLQSEVVEELLETAKKDVLEKRWERLLSKHSVGS